LAGILDRGGGGILCGLMVLWVLGDGAATRRGWWLV
jgi:hypothetical protein